MKCPSRQERSEIADRLRNRRREMESEKPPADPFFAAFVYLTNVMGAVRVGEDGNLFNRLADLIEPEERTCRVIMKWDGLDGRDPVCSECGTNFCDEKWRRLDHKFCPNCGARVVSE